MRYNSDSLEKTEEIAGEIVKNLGDKNVILLEGELGAGKTTFSQSVLKSLGARGPFTSPTFVIMKKYELDKSQIPNSKFQILNSKFKTVYHFDCYRVGAQDVLDLGWEEIIGDPQNLVLVEWPERIEEILPERNVRVLFEVVGEDERVMNLD